MSATAFVIKRGRGKTIYLSPSIPLEKRDGIVELYLNEDGELYARILISALELKRIIGVVGIDIPDDFLNLCWAAALLNGLELSQEAAPVNRLIQESPLGVKIRERLR